MAVIKVDHTFQLAATCNVVDGQAASAVQAAYELAAAGLKIAGREPAMIEVRVFAKPKGTDDRPHP